MQEAFYQSLIKQPHIVHIAEALAINKNHRQSKYYSNQVFESAGLDRKQNQMRGYSYTCAYNRTIP